MWYFGCQDLWSCLMISSHQQNWKTPVSERNPLIHSQEMKMKSGEWWGLHASQGSEGKNQTGLKLEKERVHHSRQLGQANEGLTAAGRPLWVTDRWHPQHVPAQCCWAEEKACWRRNTACWGFWYPNQDLTLTSALSTQDQCQQSQSLWKCYLLLMMICPLSLI